MKQYLELMEEILVKGRNHADRTGVGRRSLFGRQMRFDLSEGFPLLTTKNVFFKGILHENLWFLSGDTNIKYLVDNGVHIWDKFAQPDTVDVPMSVRDKVDWIKANRPDHYAAVGEQVSAEIKAGTLSDPNPDAEGAKVIARNYELLFAITGIPKTRPARNPLAGELGPVYSKQFRNISDIRVILAQEFPKYQELGFHARSGLIWEPKGGAGLAGTIVVERKVDQVANLIKNLKEHPFSSRHVMTLWDPRFIPGETKAPKDNVVDGQMALASCHGTVIQFIVEELGEHERFQIGINNGLGVTMIEYEEYSGTGPKIELLENAPDIPGKRIVYRYEDRSELFVSSKAPAILEFFNIPKYRLSCQMYVRSNDVYYGTPFNIAGYALLTMMIAQCVGMAPGDLVYTMGDVHLYADQIEGAEIQVQRTPRPLPKLWIDPSIKNIDDFKFEHFKLVDYDPDMTPLPKPPVAV